MSSVESNAQSSIQSKPATVVTYIGHSTLLVEMKGVRLLTDPVLRDRVAFLHRHSASVQPAWVQNIDVVLLSHAHSDHLDSPSLRRLHSIKRNTRIIAPVGVGSIVRRLGFEQVEEVEAGAEFQVGTLTVRVTAALHGRAKYFFERDVLCIGYVIKGDHTVYFAGDTDIFPEMAELAGTLDLALLPVWGWGPTLGVGHLDPYRAAQALVLLAPRYAIPIHWGTLVPWGLQLFRPRFLVDPPHAFAQFAGKLAPGVEVRVLSPGERFSMGAESSTPSPEILF
jgi:L-ascorbate metabolism protein UlaG (beta-lactamase superfamily)